MRLQSEFDKFGVFGIVVVLFSFHAGIRDVIDVYHQTQFLAFRLDHARQVQHRKLLGELVENAEFTFGSGIEAGNLDAAHGVANIEEAASLSAFAINGKRGADGGLDAKAIQNRAEDFVIVEAINEGFVHGYFVGHGAVNHTLVEIGSTQAPDLAGEHDVVTVMDLGEMVERAGLFGVRHSVSAAVVLNRDVTLFDVDVGRAVFAHGSQFDQVAIGLEFTQSEQQIQGADHIVDLGKHRMFAIDHGIRSGTLFGEMHDRFRFDGFNGGREEVVIHDIADEEIDLLAGKFLPNLQAIGKRADRGQGLHAQLKVPLPADEVVNDGDRVAPIGQMQGSRPSAITVSAKYSDPHVFSFTLHP